MRLDPTLRERLENSFAWHDYAHSRGKIAPDLASPEERAALPPQSWRMAWKNLANGRVAPLGPPPRRKKIRARPRTPARTNFVRSMGLQCPELAQLRPQIVPWSTLCRCRLGA